MSLLPRLLHVTCAWLLAASLGACGGANEPALESLRADLPSPRPVQALRAQALPLAPQTGYWWNPAESGRGYAIEVQGGTVFMGAYLYEPSGAATWYLAALAPQADGSYAGAMNRYSGGQSLLGAYRAPTAIVAVAQATLTLASATAGQLTIRMLDGSGTRTVPIQRFAFGDPAFAPPSGNLQSGVWWNADEGGRGYFIEAQGERVIVGSFMYDTDGQPLWYTVFGTLRHEESVSGAMQRFAGGQSLVGAYRPATTLPSAGTLTFTATSNATGFLTLPDGRIVFITRVVPPVLDACVSVKPGYNGNVETNAPSAGDSGGDGGTGGDGGGAAAGGGLGKVLGGRMRVVDLSDGTLLGEAITDGTQGLVTVKTCGRPGPFLLTLEGRAGAKYFDEGLGQLTDFGPGQALHALVDQWSEHVGVSPLTEAAYRYALNQFKGNAADIAAARADLRASGGLVGLTKAQVVQANELVKSEVNRRFTTHFELPSAKALPTPIDGASVTTALKDNRYGRSAAVNGGLVKAAQFYNPATAAPALELAAQLARDLTDGRINGYALDGSQVATAAKTTYESIGLTQASTIATNAVAQQFGVALGPALPTIEYITTAFGGQRGVTQVYDCATAFGDEVALLSDRTVTVRRSTPSPVGDGCQFTNSPDEGARVQVLRRFLTDVKLLSTNGGVTYAVKVDGTVVGWGDNQCGRLSPALPNGVYSTPQVIEGLRDVTSIRSLPTGAIARDIRGTIYYWGSAGEADIFPQTKRCVEGPNPFQSSAIAKVTSIGNIAEVFSDGTGYFALTTDGVLYGWGSAGTAGALTATEAAVNGQLINGKVLTPSRIVGLLPVRKATFANGTALALQFDGTIRAWGADTLGLAGFGTPRPSKTPLAVEGLDNIANIEAVNESVRLQKHDGTILAWDARADRLGLAQPPLRPVMIPVPERIRHIAPGFYVYFASGRIAREVNELADLSVLFR